MSIPYNLIYAVFLIIVSLIIYFLFVRDKVFDNLQQSQNIQEQFDPATIPPLREKIIEGPPRTITPSGPNPPAQSGQDTNEPIIHNDPVPVDQHIEIHETPYISEQIRHPERSYRPAPQNTQTHVAKEAGIAGESDQASPQNYQQYSYDTIQNSGEFMSGVYANDISNDTAYSTL